MENQPVSLLSSLPSLRNIWVQLGEGEPVLLEINEDKFVSHLKKLVKAEFPNDLEKIDLGNITLRYNDTNENLLPYMKISALNESISNGATPLKIVLRDDRIKQLIEEGIQPLHCRISELQQPITERMSACSATKFNNIQHYFQLRFDEIEWNLEGLALQSGFEWNGRGEDECIPHIISFLSTILLPYQLRDSRNVQVAVEYTVRGRMAIQNGKLDITVLLPSQIATLVETILSQCIAAIEIKTPAAILDDPIKCINQSRLQLLALNSGGNLHNPFVLLTNATDYWRFSWLSKNNFIYSTLIINQQQGLAALYDSLQMQNKQPHHCPFSNRYGVMFPDFGGGGNNGDVADMSEFYDDMTEVEIFQHKSKVGIAKFFEMMTPSQKANFEMF